MMPRVLFFTALFFFYTALAFAHDTGPWSVSHLSPAFEAPVERKYAPSGIYAPQDSEAIPFIWAIRFFQHYISPIDGPTCPMLPTCSEYGYFAFKKHGAAIGFIMTSDRLLRDNPFKGNNYTLIETTSGWFRLSDPISNNDFWWYKY